MPSSLKLTGIGVDINHTVDAVIEITRITRSSQTINGVTQPVSDVSVGVSTSKTIAKVAQLPANPSERIGRCQIT